MGKEWRKMDWIYRNRPGVHVRRERGRGRARERERETFKAAVDREKVMD